MTDNMWFVEEPIAHRGLHNKEEGIPENSLLSFESAVEQGCAIELDISIAGDGEFVVFHDKSLDRMTGRHGLVSKLSSAEVTKINLLNSNQHIPTLREALHFVAGKVPLLIEVKNHDQVGWFESTLLSLLESYKGRFALQSFNPFSLAWFKKNKPAYPRGQIAGDFRGEDMSMFRKLVLRNLLLNSVSDPQFISYDIRALPTWAVRFWKTKGIPVIGWTVKSTEDQKRAERWCDNYIFESITPWETP